MIALIANFASMIGFKPKEAERFAKFLVVGTIGFIIDFGTLTFLVEVVDLPGLVSENSQFSETVGLIIANTISFTLAVLSNFTLNRYWTYPDSRSKPLGSQLIQFSIVSLLGLLIRTPIIAVLEPLFNRLFSQIAALPIGFIKAEFLANNLALAVAVIVVMFWNFFINRYWTYSDVE